MQLCILYSAISGLCEFRTVVSDTPEAPSALEATYDAWINDFRDIYK